MLLAGLTGGLGAGKSTVARMLQDGGAVLVDADELARRALEPGTSGYKQVCDLFGDEVLTPSGELDREAIAVAVFGEPERRRALESIVHPEVFRLLAEIVETGFHDAVDLVVVITAPEEERLARAIRDRGMSADGARARIRAQLGDAEREAVADVVIRNDGTLADLQGRVDELWEQLRARVD